MARATRLAGVVMFGAISACVTVNVYFPAAAAERAADRIIQEIYGTDSTAPGATPPAPPAPSNERSALDGGVPTASSILLELLIPAAHAQQPDINISSPAIQALKTAMEQRHQSLSQYYQSGAIGMTRNGTLDVVDQAKIDLRQRNAVKQLLTDENNDRNRLYAEIAIANGHSEWERDIRNIFADRWIGNAPAGWWFQASSGWQQK